MNVLRVAQVIHKTGIPRPSLYRMMAQGRFPRPIKLAERAVGWVERDVDHWIAERMAATREAV